MAVWKSEKVMCFCTFDFLEQKCCVFGHFRCLKQWKCQVFFDFLSAEKKWKCYAFLDIFDFDILLFFVCTLSDEISGFSTNKSGFLKENLDFDEKSGFLTKKLVFGRKNLDFIPKVRSNRGEITDYLMGKHLARRLPHIYPLAFSFPEPVHLFPPG